MNGSDNAASGCYDASWRCGGVGSGGGGDSIANNSNGWGGELSAGTAYNQA